MCYPTFWNATRYNRFSSLRASLFYVCLSEALCNIQFKTVFACAFTASVILPCSLLYSPDYRHPPRVWTKCLRSVLTECRTCPLSGLRNTWPYDDASPREVLLRLLFFIAQPGAPRSAEVLRSNQEFCSQTPVDTATARPKSSYIYAAVSKHSKSFIKYAPIS